MKFLENEDLSPNSPIVVIFITKFSLTIVLGDEILKSHAGNLKATKSSSYGNGQFPFVSDYKTVNINPKNRSK